MRQCPAPGRRFHGQLGASPPDEGTMKYLFLTVAILLLLAGFATYVTEPAMQGEVPVIYWVIDPAPARAEQIATFHVWLVKNGHGKEYKLDSARDVERFLSRNWSAEMIRAIRDANPGSERVWEGAAEHADLPLTITVPAVEMRVDSASNDLNKKLIQGLSRVGGDVIEAYGGGKQIQYLAAAGMLADVTESAQELGFDPSQTYEALAPALFYEGKQYAFPRNPAQTMYWVNKATFRKHGQPPPPSRWTVEDFERLGIAFVTAANPAGERRQVFFADRVIMTELRRSMGLSIFDETLTHCTLDDQRNADAMALMYKWTYVDNILPSAADRASFDTEGGWGGTVFPAVQWRQIRVVR